MKFIKTFENFDQEFKKPIGSEMPKEELIVLLTDEAKKEILNDIEDKKVPNDVKDFSTLHDYVDANMYIGTDTFLNWMDANDLIVSDDESMEIFHKVADNITEWLKSR